MSDVPIIKTRVNPKYTYKIYSTALAAVSLHFILVYFNIFPAQYLNLPVEIKNLVWPLNASYEAALKTLHFSPSDINIVTQTTAATSIIMMIALLVRFVLELAMPGTEFRSEVAIGIASVMAVALVSFWILQSTDERGLFQLDIHLPMLKNLFELNFMLFGLYFTASEFLCQIVSYFCQVGARKAGPTV
jgi:hypothetical protein